MSGAVIYTQLHFVLSGLIYAQHKLNFSNHVNIFSYPEMVKIFFAEAETDKYQIFKASILLQLW